MRDRPWLGRSPEGRFFSTAVGRINAWKPSYTDSIYVQVPFQVIWDSTLACVTMLTVWLLVTIGGIQSDKKTRRRHVNKRTKDTDKSDIFLNYSANIKLE
jgi:hypothetical protein